MKKELKITAIVLATIIFFLAGFGLGQKIGIKLSVDNEYVTEEGESAVSVATPVVTDTQPSVALTAPATEASTAAPTSAPAAESTTAAQSAGTSTTAPATTVSAPTSIPSSKDEVVNKYVELVNKAKREPNITVHKTAQVDLQCTSCSVSWLTGTVNNLLPTFMKPSDNTYTVKDGVEVDGAKTATDFILPAGKDCTLTPAGIASASAAPEGDGYKMTLKFVQETSTFDGTNSTYPVHHESAMVPLNLATLELPAGAKITEANMTYSGATITAWVNGEGKITKIDLDLPMEGEGTGKLGASLSLGIAGSNHEVYELTYTG